MKVRKCQNPSKVNAAWWYGNKNLLKRTVSIFQEKKSILLPQAQEHTQLSNHGVSVDDRFIIFKLKACGHAYVGLMSGPTENDPLHEFVFGGDYNTASFLRAGKSYSLPDLDRTTGTILDCNQYKELWITWNEYTISVGLGLQVTGSAFLTWTSPNPLLAIKNIGIATAFDDTGEWTFYTKDDIQTTTSRMTDVSTKLLTTSVGSTKISSSSTSQRVVDDTTTGLQTTESKETTVGSTKISSSSTSQLAVDDITTGLPTTETNETPTCASSCIKTYTCKCPNPSNRPPTSIPSSPLKLDKKTLSSYRNQPLSASDSRKSSYYIGCVGITVLVLSVAFIAILDCLPSS